MTPPAAAAAPSVRPRRAPAPRAPRRISGPARPTTAPRRLGARAPAAQPGLVLGLLSALEALAQHRLLDRLIRGRIWIGLVAFALIGIVTLQLGLLKLNGGIGRALEHEAALQRENSALSIENSELAAGTRVESSATKLGMVFVPVNALRFLVVNPHADVAKAAAALASAAHAAAQAGEASASESSTSGAGEVSSEASAAAEGTARAESTASAEGAASSEGVTSSETGASSEAGASSETSASASASGEAGSGGEAEGGSESSVSEAPGG